MIGLLTLLLALSIYSEPLHPTLDGMVMCGYQGWFRTASDPNGHWVHWVRKHGQSYLPTTDYLPDISEATPDEIAPLPLKFKDGASANVFSSDNRTTVGRHFKWMKEYGIDGVFVQRFPVSFYSRDAEPRPFRESGDRVLQYCRDAATENGRSCSLMYDLSGLHSNAAEIVIKDWKHLISSGIIDFKTQQAWQFHKNRPLISLWGIGFNDSRKYDLDVCETLVDFFKAAGCTVLVGVPFYWRTLERDTIKDRRLHGIIGKADVVHSWSVGRYRDSNGVSHAHDCWSADTRWCEERELTFMPVLFPGFSWANLKGKADMIQRRGGKFLWEQFGAAQRAGVKCIYVAMFDELDEGTQIFKTELNPPAGENFEYQRFNGEPADHYLWLTGEATSIFRSGKPFPPEIPERR